MEQTELSLKGMWKVTENEDLKVIPSLGIWVNEGNAKFGNIGYRADLRLGLRVKFCHIKIIRVLPCLV